MVRRAGTVRAAAAALACVLGLGSAAHGASVVFTGDPVDAGTGQPYEILPGLPLVTAGIDGRLGTADDVIDPSRVGDVDLVVRLGNVPSGAAIPPPAAARSAVATATAGLRGAGVAIPFTAYLSDGAVGAGLPYGNLLAAADMNGFPVIVTLFADRDGDGVIGPSGKDPRRDVRALAELTPVGTEVAVFDGSGKASGTIMTTVGGPASKGGITLVATATAFTGPYDPGFFGGNVPIGPAITTAQPFLPERDPTRIFSDPGPLEVTGTLNPRLRAAGLPDPHGALALALRVKNGSPTTDTARAVAGPAVCARIVEPARGRGLPADPPSLALGTVSSAGRLKLALVAVDRLGNPTDPAPGMSVRIVAEGPVALAPDHDGAPASETIALTHTKGEKVGVQATGAGAATVRVLVNGALCQTLAVDARSERNRGGSDAVVALKGRADYRSLAAAAAGATDRDGDGRITVVVGDGVYRETVPLTRAVELVGAGSDRTVVDARGTGAALTLGNAGAVVRGVTASGGTTGVAVTVPMTVRELDARGNVGAGITLGVGGAAAAACIARENGGAGFSVIAAPASVDGNLALGNAGAGIESTATAAGVAITGNVLTLNGRAGMSVLNGNAPTITGNASGGNGAEGLTLEETTGGVLSGNRLAGNEGNGLTLNKSDGVLVDGNDCSANHGFGMRIDRSADDFDAAPGTQDAPGSNDVSDNRKGPLDVR